MHLQVLAESKLELRTLMNTSLRRWQGKPWLCCQVGEKNFSFSCEYLTQ